MIDGTKLTKDERKIERWFFKRSKMGLVPSVKELRAYCSRNNISHTLDYLKELKYHFLYTAIFTSSKRNKYFAGPSFMRYGLYFIDFAQFHEKYSKFNGGMKGFIILVEGISDKWFIFPVRNKTSESWENAIWALVQSRDSDVRVIISDRDAACSKNFLKKIKAELGIGWVYAHNRSKSFRAELAIKEVKERLSIAMKLANSKKWVDKIESIVKHHNDQFVKNTNMKRSSINKDNFISFLQQKLDVGDPSALTNITDTKHLITPLANQLFKYDIGDRVLISETLNTKVKKNIFKKKSMQGRYSTEIFTVVDRQLKSKYSLYVIPVYKLKSENSGVLKGIFYEKDVIPVKWEEKNVQK